MELQLILEVEKRRMLYDKDLNVYKKQNVRDDAWKEVASILHLSESECRKKWRSLRDQFIKIFRTEQVSGATKRKTPWIYYNQMRFLIPHIGIKESCGFWRNSSPNHTIDGSKKEVEAEESKIFYSDAIIGSLANNADSREEVFSKQRKRKHCESDEEKVSAKWEDPDEQFLLSYLPTLRRFTQRQNALARMRIQQVLYEIEFGSEDNQMPTDNTAYNVYISPTPYKGE